MARGLFLMRISLLTLVLNSLFGCSPKIGEFRITAPDKDHYFLAGSEELRLLIPNFSGTDSKTLKIDSSNLYHITSIEQLKNNKAKVVLNLDPGKRPVPRLTLSYTQGDSLQRFISIVFYSKFINIDTLTQSDTVFYHRNLDIVPPLIHMSSLQVSPFLLCQSDSVYREFSSFKELYMISYFFKPGEYVVADGDCEKPLFTYIIKGKLPAGTHL